MSFQAMTWAVSQDCKGAAAKLVLLMLANHANGHTGECTPSHKLLADECNISVASLKTQIKKLAELGFVTIIPRVKDGVNLPNQYVVNMRGGSKSDRGVGQNLATEPVLREPKEYYCADLASESEPDAPNSPTKEQSSSPQNRPMTEQNPEDIAGTIPLAGGKEWVVTKSYVAILAETYPGVEPAHEFRKLKLWLDANPSRMSATISGAKRRVTSWFQRAQDNGGRRGYGK